MYPTGKTFKGENFHGCIEILYFTGKHLLLRRNCSIIVSTKEEFVGNTSVVGCTIAKTANVFPLEIFSVYGISWTRLTDWTCRLSWKMLLNNNPHLFYHWRHHC